MNEKPTMSASVDEMRRLSLVRHIYSLAVAQSRSADPTAGLALLGFHDSVEMFMQIAAEHHGVGKERAEFMDYWSLLSGANIALGQKDSMRRLNAARRTLKHQGVLPANVEIEGFRSATTNFLASGCAVVFGVEFDQVSLVDLVSPGEVQDRLRVAHGALNRGDHATAMAEAALAFQQLLRDYEAGRRALNPSHRTYSLVSRGPSLEWAAADLGGGLEFGGAQAGRRLAEQINSLADRLSEGIVVAGYSLDFDAYLSFKSNAPVIRHFLGGHSKVEWLHEPTKDTETVRRSLDFVIDASLRLMARLGPNQ